jgi:hypothetical protein
MQKLSLYNGNGFDASYAKVYEAQVRSYYDNFYSHLQKENPPPATQLPTHGMNHTVIVMAK